MFRAKALFFFTALTAAAQVTSIPSGVGGGAGVGGASNLTTVGAIPYVSAAGILNQTANLSFDATSNRLVLGSATIQRFSTDLSLSRASAGVLQVGDGAANANGTVQAGSIVVSKSGGGNWIQVTDTSSFVGITATGASESNINIIHSGASSGSRVSGINNASGITSLRFLNDSNAAVTARAFAAFNHNGNVQFTNVGIESDGGYKVDIAKSGVSGTLRVYDQTATTGVTKSVIRAGAGQSTTNLTEWQNSGGSQVAAIQSNGDFVSGSVTANAAFNVGSVGSPMRFWGGSSSDVAIRRRSDGLIGIDNNTAIGTTPGNARDLMVRGVYAAETTSDPSAADLTIAGSNAQDTFRLYMKNDKLVVAYNRSGTVNYLTIPLDGATTTWTQSTTAP